MRYASAEDYTSLRSEFGLIWLLYGVAVVVVLALVARPALVAAAFLVALVGIAAYYLPESLVVLFLVTGPLKATEFGARAAAASPNIDLTVLASIALVVAIAVSVWRHRSEPFSLPAPAVCFVALGLLLLVGVLFSPDPAAGLDKALTFQTFSALAFLAPLAIVRSRTSFFRLLTLLVVLSVVVAFMAEAAERSESVLVLPGADNQIQVGLLLGLGLVAIVAYLWPASSGWLRLVWLPPAAFLLTKLVSTGSRSALLGALFASVVAVVWLAASGRRERIAALALVGVLAALVPVAWVTSSPAVKDRYLVTVVDARGGGGLDSGGADRSAVAVAAVDVFASHPLGAGTAAYSALTGYEWPHNVILELAAELGLMGVSAFLGLVVGIAVALRRATRRPRLRSEVIGAGSVLVLPFTMAFSSFDLNGNRALWFACGLALTATELRR